MEKYVHLFLRYLTKALEFVIAALLACAIVIMTVQLALSLGELTDISTYPSYEELLSACFNLIIGVELIRMLCLHTAATVFEVLLFVIARQVIIDHSSPLNTLLGVISIAILFATKKFLFSAAEESGKKEKTPD